MTNYEKDLDKLKEKILKDGDTLVSKRDLLERFCEVDEAYNGSPWNLLQILANIHILIGEEPCEDAVSRKAVLDIATVIETDDFSGNEIMEVVETDDIKVLPSVTPTRIETVTEFADRCRECGKQKKGKWVLHTYMPHKIYCSECEKDSPYNKRWFFCPNCGAEMGSEE